MTAAAPDTLDPAYSLADVEKRATQNPSFQIPAADRRREIPIGHYARLVFCDISAGTRQPAADHLWVKVAAKVCDGASIHYIATLHSVPHYIAAAQGDLVRFEPRHVADIQGPPEV